MLVPKEKYQKLLESHKRSMNNRNEENISNMDNNTLKQREVGGLHDINMEIENKKKVNSYGKPKGSIFYPCNHVFIFTKCGIGSI